MECSTCDSRVHDGTTECPVCGFHPRRSLVATGLLYAFVGFVFSFAAVGLSIIVWSKIGIEPTFGLSIITWNKIAIGIWFAGVIVGMFVVFYGLWLAFAGRKATVDENLDVYLLPIFR